MKLKESKPNCAQSSGDMNGDMKLGSVIRKANVPEKIRIFAWCVASNSLVVQVNRVTHH